MGLLKTSNILSWSDIKMYTEDIKTRGINQFITVYKRNKEKRVSMYAFGEELELMTVIKKNNRYFLHCRSEDIVGKVEGCTLEYARYMIEICSSLPYTDGSISKLEGTILQKIHDVEDILQEDVSLLLLPCFFKMCHDNFYDFDEKTRCDRPKTIDVTRSLHFPDNAITQHKRFSSFTENIRNRRGRPIEGYIKIMRDKNTNLSDPSSYIHIDSMGQGMGCCCLQVTIQGKSLEQSRYIYDMMAILSPLLLRLTRGTPIANGMLLETETRWDMLEMSVDCRTDEERGSLYINKHDSYPYEATIPKSRFSPIDVFISQDKRNLDEFNDIKVPIHEPFYKKMLDEGVDERLSRHVASLFVRDPILSYDVTNEKKFDDFENIQSSNWRSVRFKIPTEEAEPELQGWKIEVRPMEIQATPFENAAFVYFVFLLSEAILEYNLNLYIPISNVDTNFIYANKFIRTPEDFKDKLDEDLQMFFYRTNISDNGKPEIKKGTLREIFIGTGLLDYVKKIITDKFADEADTLMKYVTFIEDKLRNRYLSLSDWLRGYVLKHKAYMNDSVLTEEIIYDLIDQMIQIRKKNTLDYLKN